MGTRSEALARRVEQGAEALAQFAQTLTDAQWRSTVAPDGRQVGVIIHHVANMYPIEIDLASVLASARTRPWRFCGRTAVPPRRPCARSPMNNSIARRPYR